jgi:hypothetical protein
MSLVAKTQEMLVAGPVKSPTDPYVYYLRVMILFTEMRFVGKCFVATFYAYRAPQRRESLAFVLAKTRTRRLATRLAKTLSAEREPEKFSRAGIPSR